MGLVCGGRQPLPGVAGGWSSARLSPPPLRPLRNGPLFPSRKTTPKFGLPPPEQLARHCGLLSWALLFALVFFLFRLQSVPCPGFHIKEEVPPSPSPMSDCKGSGTLPFHVLGSTWTGAPRKSKCRFSPIIFRTFLQKKLPQTLPKITCLVDGGDLSMDAAANRVPVLQPRKKVKCNRRGAFRHFNPAGHTPPPGRSR